MLNFVLMRSAFCRGVGNGRCILMESRKCQLHYYFGGNRSCSKLSNRWTLPCCTSTDRWETGTSPAGPQANQALCVRVSSFTPPFYFWTDWANKSTTRTPYVFQGPVAINSSWHPLNTNASLLRESSLCPWTKPFRFNTHNTDTRSCEQRLLCSTPINRFSDRKKLSSIIWHYNLNRPCAVLILASDEVILGCQQFDVYSATVDGQMKSRHQFLTLK